MYFVYIIKSKEGKTFYTGVTTNLKRRLTEHNSSSTKYTSSKGLFSLIWYCGFSNKQKAYDFEKYLKSGSGIAFRYKHLI